MAKRSRQWAWFNATAWLHDPKLNMCSLAARGFWIECLCWMWNDNSEVLDGTPEQLQRLLRHFGDEFFAPLAELESAGVCTVDRDSDGFITIHAGKWVNQTRSRFIPKAIKDQVLSAGKCKACGSTEKLEVDHVVAFYHGGTHDIRNLQCLCRTCNRRKKTKGHLAFMRSRNG